MVKKLKIPLIIIAVVLLTIGVFIGYMAHQLRHFSLLETAQLSDSLYVIQGEMSNMYLLKTAGGFIAFDASSGLEKLEEGCRSLSIDPASVKAIFLTHSDEDHAGGVPLFPNAAVYLSEDEVPLLKENKHRHFFGIPHKNKIDVASYTTLKDNDTVMIGDLGITAVATPGHTRGSMCFHSGGDLFTGDLCMIRKEAVTPMLKIFTEDMSMDSMSIRKIATLQNVTSLCTAHNGRCKNPQKALAEWR